MHSLIGHEYTRATAAERRRLAAERPPGRPRSQPPPLRRGAAIAVARLAVRLDADAARRRSEARMARGAARRHRGPLPRGRREALPPRGPRAVRHGRRLHHPRAARGIRSATPSTSRSRRPPSRPARRPRSTSTAPRRRSTCSPGHGTHAAGRPGGRRAARATAVVIAPGTPGTSSPNPGPGAARAAVLLRARLLARGHRPHRRMRVDGPRAAALAATLMGLLAVLAASASPAGAAPVIGVGEQRGQIFSDPPWTELGLRDTRLVVSWDVASIPFERADVDGYLAAAEAAGARVMVTFGHSRARSRAKQLPSVARYRRAFLASSAGASPRCRRSWPGTRPTTAPSRPATGRSARRALLRRDPPHCPAAASWPRTSWTRDWCRWAARFRRAAGHRRGSGGCTTTSTPTASAPRAPGRCSATVQGDVWFTETGGLVERQQRLDGPPARLEAHAAKATDWRARPARELSPRIKRVYLYHWRPAPEPFPTWDSALLDREGRPRLAYDVLHTWVRRAQRARGGR